MVTESPKSQPRVLVCRAGTHPNAFESLIPPLGIDLEVFEALKLESVNPDQSALDCLHSLGREDLLLFVSANAVRFALPYLKVGSGSFQVAAVGQKTASLLSQHGFNEVITPQSAEDSEGLLAAIRETQPLRGRLALIVKGRGGRDILAQGLKDLGFEVHILELYERVPTMSVTKAIRSALLDGALDGVCAMSNEVIAATLNAFGPECHQALCSLPWILIHPRQAEFAKRQGIERCFLVQSNDQDGIEAVLRSIKRD